MRFCLCVKNLTSALNLQLNGKFKTRRYVGVDDIPHVQCRMLQSQGYRQIQDSTRELQQAAPLWVELWVASSFAKLIKSEGNINDHITYTLAEETLFRWGGQVKSMSV